MLVAFWLLLKTEHMGKPWKKNDPFFRGLSLQYKLTSYLVAALTGHGSGARWYLALLLAAPGGALT